MYRFRDTCLICFVIYLLRFFFRILRLFHIKYFVIDSVRHLDKNFKVIQSKWDLHHWIELFKTFPMVSNSCMWLNCVQSYVRLKKPLCLCIFMPRAKLSFFIFVTAFSDFNVPLRESMSPQISIKFVPMVADTIQWGVSIGIRGVLDLDFATETEKRREVGFAIFERFYTSNK